MKKAMQNKQISENLSMQDVLEKFGERLKTLRTRLDLTQRSMGDKIDMAASYISDVEGGKTNPGFELLYKMSYQFKVNPLYLFFGEEPYFVKEKPDQPEFNIGDGETGQKLREILWLSERSEIFRYSLLEFVFRYKRTHKKLIAEDIADFEANEKNHSSSPE